MSVLIKGLNIKPCKDGFDGTGLVIIGYDDKLYAVSHKQIIPLPDHGDLIDRDALIKSLRDYACKPCKEYGVDKNGDRCAWCSFDDAFARIEKAKAVIPVERSEE